MNYKIIPAVFALALTSLACGFSVNIPKAPTPGPEVTDQIMVAAPTSGEARLSLTFGAGDLNVEAGALEGKLVAGTATYNIPDLKPEVKQNDGDVQIQQGDLKFSGLPSLNNVKNEWDLKLGSTPMDLNIEAGAYQGTFEFGGLALTGLTIKNGAANVQLSFSSPNQTEMSVLRFETGASNVKLTGLANANFNTMIFQGGAGDYTLDFTGNLKRDATVSIDSGLSNVTLRIPKNVNVVATVEGGLKSVSTSSNWAQDGDTYTQKGEGPTLTFIIKMGAGSLTLTD
ncbi:MAG TPA: toast rack family protein [Anaerolineales bacterium]|nr:toast rack family protein [Anaerolineales bacterium]